MKRLLIIALTIGLAAAAKSQDSLLCARLDSLLQAPMFETSTVGIMVYDLEADSVIFKKNERQLLRPASTMKLVTAITALEQLGGDYLLNTRLYWNGRVNNRVLEGDVYCVGGMDPLLDRTDVAAFAEEIRGLGVDTIRGKIVTDVSMKDPLEFGEGWCWDDDNPHLMVLSLGRKDTFIDELLRELTDNGVILDSVVLANGQKPANVSLLASRSHTLDEVLVPMMKVSDNFFAEAMFYQIAASTGHRPAKAGDAKGLMKRLFNKIGLGRRNYRLADGSGLSLYNYLSAELETMLLRYAWHTPAIYDHLYDALPIAAIDGTLKNRMEKTAAAGNVHAKTGTVTGVSALAGYCTTADGRQLAFSIINQGIMESKTGRDFQDRVCKVLCETGYKELTP